LALFLVLFGDATIFSSVTAAILCRMENSVDDTLSSSTLLNVSCDSLWFLTPINLLRNISVNFDIDDVTLAPPPSLSARPFAGLELRVSPFAEDDPMAPVHDDILGRLLTLAKDQNICHIMSSRYVKSELLQKEEEKIKTCIMKCGIVLCEMYPCGFLISIVTNQLWCILLDYAYFETNYYTFAMQ
jgi:hypothetical protein